jgi:hypothetical protein
MTKKKGANNQAPQTENQVVENQAPEVQDLPGVDEAISTTNKALEQYVDEIVGPVAHTPEEVTVLSSTEELTPERHIDEEVSQETGIGLDAPEEAPLLTDEQILEKVAEAAYLESGHTGWEELSEDFKKETVKIAKYFRDNPEAHPDQFHSTIKAEKGLKDYYDYPEQEREQAEAFAASVKNAYRA